MVRTRRDTVTDELIINSIEDYDRIVRTSRRTTPGVSSRKGGSATREAGAAGRHAADMIIRDLHEYVRRESS